MVVGSILSRDELVQMAKDAKPLNLDEIAFDEVVDMDRFAAKAAMIALGIKDISELE